MNWIDLAVVSICLWGGVEGYLKGARVIIRKILLVCLAIVLANIFKSYFVYYFVNVSALDEIIHEVVFMEVILPVSGTPSSDTVNEIIGGLPLPTVFKKEIWQRLLSRYDLYKYSPEFLYFAEIINGLILKTISFLLALCLWLAWMNLLEVVSGANNKHRSGRKEGGWRWAGVFFGLCRHYLLVSLAAGIISVWPLICPPAANVLDFDGSALGSLSLQIFNFLRIW